MRWLTLGACAVGAAHHRHRVFALAEVTTGSVPVTERLDVDECGARKGSTVLPTPSASSYGSNQGGAAGRVGPVRHSLNSMARCDLLPTPTVHDSTGRGAGDADYWQRRRSTGRNHGLPLDAVVALLPTPTAGEASGGRRDRSPGPDGRIHRPDGSSHGIALSGAVTLLPTPRATDGVNGGPGQRGSSGDLAMSSAVQPEHWGRFAAAITRHGVLFGEPPAPTEANRNGAPRLAAAFAEWLMCVPAGRITGVLPRNAALKAIGNGVCPPQAARAWDLLTGHALLDTSLGLPVASSNMASVNSTNDEIRVIQERQRTARERVLSAAHPPLTEATGLTNPFRADVSGIVSAALMELASVWRDEAAWWDASGKRGGKGTAKTLTECASRVAGFAVGLAQDAANVPIPSGDPTKQWDVEIIDSAGRLCFECLDADEDPALWCDCRYDCDEQCPPDRGCRKRAHSTERHVLPGSELIIVDDPDPGQAMAAFTTYPIVDAPEHAQSDANQITDPIMDYLTGASTTYTPARRPEQILNDLKIQEEKTRTMIPDVPGIIDNPFSDPGPLRRVATVAALPYAALEPLAAAVIAKKPRGHVSHSYVESYESCSLSAMLRDASRAELIGASRPMWGAVGGSAFHAAVERIERSILHGSVLPVVADDELDAFWLKYLNEQIATTAANAGTYADPATWYTSNRGKEGFDWWRVEGARMVKMYQDRHGAPWREVNKLLMVGDTVPCLEFPYSMTVRSIDGTAGVTAEGYIDQAWLNLRDHVVTVRDLKSGSRDPISTFQLGEYAHALLMAMGMPAAPDNRPIMGSYWLARKGIETTASDVIRAHPLAELQYRYSTAMRGTLAGIFSPHVTNLCTSCSVRDYCPTTAGA